MLVGLLAVFIGIMALGMPVAFAIMFACFIYFIFAPDVPTAIFVQRIVAGVDSFPLLAVPFFVLTGTVMSRGGIASRLFGLADALVGHMKGGLGQVNVIQSFFIGGMCGAANADAAIDSKTIVPVMVSHGYGRGFSAAVTASSSIIAAIIPPGLGLVIYALQAEASIGRMFIGGVIPGMLISIFLMFVVALISRKRGYGGAHPRQPFSLVVKNARTSFWALMMPVLLIGGLRLGVFTPTELGAIAAVYALFVSIVIYKELKWNEVLGVFIEACLSTVVIMFIIAASASLSYIITWEDIPQSIVERLLDFSNNRYVILLLVNLSLLIMATVFESVALLVILTPILAPVMQNLGVDLIHFGLIMVINVGIGGLTPPVGTILYTVCSITGVSAAVFTRNIIPFLVALIAVLFLITYVPWLVLFLPDLIMG